MVEKRLALGPIRLLPNPRLYGYEGDYLAHPFPVTLGLFPN